MQNMKDGLSNRRHVRAIGMLLPLGVLAVTLIVDWPVLSAQATLLDDGQFLKENPLVQNPSWSSARPFLTEGLHPSTVSGYYLPLSMISLMLDHAMGGRPDNLAPFHRTSLLLHLLNVSLLMALACLLFRSVWASAIAVLFFALHPLTVEPLAWVGERKTVLATFFALASLLCYVRWAQGRRRFAYAGSLGLYVLALLSKPTATPLPLAMVLMDYWPLNRLSRRSLLEKLPFLAVGGASAVISTLSHASTSGLSVLHGRSPWESVLLACYLVVFYVGKMIRPAGLSPVYPEPHPLSLSNTGVLAALVGTCALALGLILSVRRSRALVAGSLIFLVLILPTLGIVGYSWVGASDKYVYLPAGGVVLVLAAGLKWILDAIARCGGARWPTLVLGLAVGAVGMFEAAGVRRYLACWRDSETLSHHMLAIAPGHSYVLAGMGLTLLDEGRTDEAIEYLVRAVRADSRNVAACNCLGIAYARQNRIGEGVEQFRIAVATDPNYAEGYANLGSALLRLGRPDEAIKPLRRALALKPIMPKAQLTLAEALAMTGRPDEAMHWFRRSLAYWQGDAAVCCDLGDTFVRQGRTAEAIECYTAAWRVAPASPRVLNNLAWLLATSDGIDRQRAGLAVALAEQACREAGREEPGTFDTLAAAYAGAGRYSEAVRTAERAIELATAAQQHDLAAEIRGRLELYRAGRAYRERPAASAPSAR